MRDDVLRAQCLTASELPAILGLDPYGRTPLSIYLLKLGLVDPPPETPELRWGRLIEAAMAEAYAEDTGAPLIRVSTRRHPTVPCLAGTPDRLIGTSPRQIDYGVEFKTVGFQHVRDWSQGVPLYVVAQVSLYMSIFDVDRWDVGRLVLHNRDWQILTVSRDRELEALLLEAGQRFVTDYLEPQIPPPMDGSSAATQYLTQTYRTHTEEWLQDDGRYRADALHYFHTRQARDAYQAKLTQLEQCWKVIIGEHVGLRGEGYKLSWKADRAGTRRWFATCTEEVLNGHAASRETTL